MSPDLNTKWVPITLDLTKHEMSKKKLQNLLTGAYFEQQNLMDRTRIAVKC